MSKSFTRAWRVDQYFPFHSSSLQLTSSGLLASRKMSISSPIATPMICSLPRTFSNSMFQNHMSVSDFMSQLTGVPSRTLALFRLTHFKSFPQACWREYSPPQLGCHGLKSRRDVTCVPSVFGQTAGTLLGQSLKVVSSMQRPFRTGRAKSLKFTPVSHTNGPPSRALATLVLVVVSVVVFVPETVSVVLDLVPVRVVVVVGVPVSVTVVTVSVVVV
mmetsp:Transcript_51914/g.166203  ORF Transcript_51914/g.166203 Transcript_51914/m.166203 type:complete len:217 (-) Transcript_51914:474-1124(-)